MSTHRALLVFVFCWVGLLICARIHLFFFGGGFAGCSETGGCEQIFFDQRAHLLGVPLHTLAAVYFALAGATLFGTSCLPSASAAKLIIVTSAMLWLGLVAAAYSLVLQVFVFRKICPYCLSIDVVLCLNAALAFPRQRLLSPQRHPVPYLLASVQGGAAAILILTFASRIPKNSDNGEILAKVNGQVITMTEARRALAVTIQPFEEMKYGAEDAWLKAMIGQTLVAQNSKAEGVTTENYFLRHLGTTPSKDPEWEVRKERWIDELRKTAQIEIFLQKPVPAEVRLDLQQTVVVGDIRAPIKVVVFSDFECPFCKLMTPALDHLLHRHPSDVALAYWQFPLDMHVRAKRAAAAACCAQLQNKFAAYHDLLCQTSDLSDTALRAAAEKVEMDLSRFDRDINSEAIAHRVEETVSAGRALGIDSIPSIFINGKLVGGMLDDDDLESLYRQEIVSLAAK